MSYKNERELDQKIDKSLPSVRPSFTRGTLLVDSVNYDVYYRDIIACIRALYGDPEFTRRLIFAPEVHWADEQRTNRLYHDMHTGKWWWRTQVRVCLFIPSKCTNCRLA